MESKQSILRQVCCYLADNCDYASSQDGIGFNGIDTYVGHNLALLEEEYWDNSIIHEAAGMLLKYKKQILKNKELDYDLLKKIHEETKQAKPIYSLSDEVKQKKIEQQKKNGKKDLYEKKGLLYFEFDKCFINDVLSDIKDIPGRVYSSSLTPHWFVPTDSAFEILITAIKHKFSITEEAYNLIIKELNSRSEKIKESSATTAKEISIKGLYQDEDKKLLPYQNAGINFLLKNPNSIIADEMGLGKTLQSIATVQKMNAFPSLIITPSFLKKNWERELKQWLPELSNIQIVKNGNTKLDKKAKVIIINYELVKKFQNDLEKIKFKALICDESHYLKNYKALRTKAVTELSQILKDSLKTKLLISGTPFLNRPRELVSQLQILDKIDNFGGTYGFLNKYCYDKEKSNEWQTSYDGAINLDELNRKLRETCFLRREKQDVLADLPPKTRVIQNIEISNKKEYKEATENLISYIGEKAKLDNKIYASIAHLSQEEKQQAVNEYKNSKEAAAARAEVLVRTTTLRKVTGQGKIKESIQWIEDFLETGQKLIVFGVHKEVLNTLADQLSKYGIVMATGEQSPEERDDAMQKFQNDDNIRLFIGSIKAAGVGLTLTKASNVLFVEFEWRPGDHEQAEDRAHRIGQKDNVTAWYLLDENTIDFNIYNMLERKRQTIKQGTQKLNNIDYIDMIRDINNKSNLTELSQNSTDLFKDLDKKINYHEEITELSQHNDIIVDVDIIDTELSHEEKEYNRKKTNQQKMQSYRRKKGIKSREEYLKQNTISKDKPWKKYNISRANYYRKKKENPLFDKPLFDF